MNRLHFSAVNLVVLFFACLSYAGDSNLVNPYVISYPFKSAFIHYIIKNEYGHGKTSEGTEVIYIKRDNLAKVTKMVVPDSKGTTKNTETLQISNPGYLYNIDLVKKTGIKIDNPRKYTKPAYTNLSDEEKKAFHERMNKRGITSLDLLGFGKKVGTDTILGRQCDVYQSGEELNPEKLQEALDSGENPIYMKSWVWRNAIILKVIMSGLGWSNELIATKIEENVKIPDIQFAVPSDIKVTYDKEKSEFAKQNALAKFHLLKTGESMPRKVKVKKRIIRPGEVAKGSEQKIQHAQVSSGVQKARITVKGGYDPGVIVVKKGIPVRLSFYRDETDGCSEKVVFGDFGISKKLPAYRETPVEFVPDKSGEFTFTCGMSMLEGKLVVEE